MVNNGVHMLYIQTYNDMHTYIYIYMAGGLEHLDTFGFFPIILGMSSSQLTKSYFSEG